MGDTERQREELNDSVEFVDEVVKIKTVPDESMIDSVDELNVERMKLESEKHAFIQEQSMFERQAQEKTLEAAEKLRAEKEEVENERWALLALRNAIEAEKIALEKKKNENEKSVNESIAEVQSSTVKTIENASVSSAVNTGAIPKVSLKNSEAKSLVKKKNNTSSEKLPEEKGKNTPPSKSGSETPVKTRVRNSTKEAENRSRSRTKKS